MNETGKDCQDILALLSDYADGELDEGPVAAVEAHVAGCRPCAGELTLTRSLLSGLHRIPEENAPPAVLEALRRRIQVKPKAESSWWGELFQGWQLAGLGLAGAAALGLMLVLPAERSAPPASVEMARIPESAAPTETSGKPVVARLSASSGAVRVDGKAAAGTDVALHDGSEIATRSSVTVEFPDGSTVEVSPDSRLILGAEEVQLATGSLSLSIEEQMHSFRVRTPLALVTVMGTEYRVTHRSVTSVEVSDGSVQVEALEGSDDVVILGPGQKAETRGGGLLVLEPPEETEPAAPENTSLPIGDER